MPEYNPRSYNRPTEEAPKYTSRWFDDRVAMRRAEREPAGFRVKDKR